MGNGSKKSNAVLYAGPAGDTREQVRALLVRDKFRVVDAADCGDDIVDAIEREGARLVLVDDGFQGQTSIRICERIRESIDHEAVVDPVAGGHPDLQRSTAGYQHLRPVPRTSSESR